MPEIGAGRFLCQALLDLGVCETGGFGLSPLKFVEIDAYARASGGLRPVEIMTIRKMSAAYVEARAGANDPFYKPPWRPS